jgi:hypothetical protein
VALLLVGLTRISFDKTQFWPSRKRSIVFQTASSAKLVRDSYLGALGALAKIAFQKEIFLSVWNILKKKHCHSDDCFIFSYISQSLNFGSMPSEVLNIRGAEFVSQRPNFAAQTGRKNAPKSWQH